MHTNKIVLERRFRPSNTVGFTLICNVDSDTVNLQYTALLCTQSKQVNSRLGNPTMWTLMCHAHSLNFIFAESEMTVEGIEYSKSQTLTPPPLVSFTDWDLSVPRMSVCAHKGTHKHHLSLSHTDTHSHSGSCEWVGCIVCTAWKTEAERGRPSGWQCQLNESWQSTLQKHFQRVQRSTYVACRLCFSK